MGIDSVNSNNTNTNFKARKIIKSEYYKASDYEAAKKAGNKSAFSGEATKNKTRGTEADRFRELMDRPIKTSFKTWA